VTAHPWHKLHNAWLAVSELKEDLMNDNEENLGNLNVIFEKKEDEVVQEKLMHEASAMADSKLLTVREDVEKKLASLYEDISFRLDKDTSTPIDGNAFLAWLDSKEGTSAIPFGDDVPPPEAKGATPKSPKRSPKQSLAKKAEPLVKAASSNCDDEDYEDEDYEDEDYEDEDYEEEEFDDDESPSRQSTPGTPSGANKSLSMSHSHSALPTFASERARINKEAEERRISLAVGSGDLPPPAAPKGEAVDPLANVPVYLKGGAQVSGLGPLLGNALALLYVSRHGLRESELFELLVRIKGQDDYTKSTKGTEVEAEMMIMKAMSKHKLRLIDAFRDLDRDGNGVVSHQEFREGIGRLHVDITEGQIDMLLKSMDSDHDGVVDFHEALDRFEEHARDYTHGKHRIDPESSSIESGSIAEKKSNVDLDMDFLNDSVTPGSAPLSQTLGAAVETALLTALTNLGVIQEHKEQVLMLPLEAEALREVIWWRYVGSAEGQDKWHAHIVAFFMDQAPSIRRCEELPWHLFRCRRWSALRNTLVDLRTFDLM
jgi:hypothetical protein